MSSSTRCANTPASQLCQRVTRVYIPPDRSYISVTIEVERNYDRVSSLSLDLRPMTLEEAAAAAAEAKMPRVPSDQELDTPRARARQNSSRPPAGLPGGGGGRSGGGGSRR